jgi:hypothetical protein
MTSQTKAQRFAELLSTNFPEVRAEAILLGAKPKTLIPGQIRPTESVGYRYRCTDLADGKVEVRVFAYCVRDKALSNGTFSEARFIGKYCAQYGFEADELHCHKAQKVSPINRKRRVFWYAFASLLVW